jgi:hypothetical protein
LLVLSKGDKFTLEKSIFSSSGLFVVYNKFPHHIASKNIIIL